MSVVNSYLTGLKDAIDRIPVEDIEFVIDLLQKARMNRKQIFIMGNGGSASTASHFVCDLAKNTRKKGWPEFRVIGLTDNMAIFSAYANDEGYENVFSQQLNNLLNVGDVVVAISGSGNSANVLRAVELANARGAVTVGFTGLTGGKLLDLARHIIFVPSDFIDQVEDVHLILEHMIIRSLNTMEVGEYKAQPVTSHPEETIDVMQDSNDLVREFFSNAMAANTQNLQKSNGKQTTGDLLSRINHELSSKQDMHELLSRILCLTVEYVGAKGGSIVVLDENGEVIDNAMAYAGQIQEKPAEHLKETLQNGLAGWVLENRQPALVGNTLEDPRWLNRGWETNVDFSRSAISVPLMAQERVIGVLTLTRMQSDHFTMDDLSLLTKVTLKMSYSFAAKA